MAQSEIPLDEDDLRGLMAELDKELAGAVAAPAASTGPSPQELQNAQDEAEAQVAAEAEVKRAVAEAALSEQLARDSEEAIVEETASWKPDMEPAPPETATKALAAALNIDPDEIQIAPSDDDIDLSELDEVAAKADALVAPTVEPGKDINPEATQAALDAMGLKETDGDIVITPADAEMLTTLAQDSTGPNEALKKVAARHRASGWHADEEPVKIVSEEGRDAAAVMGDPYPGDEHRIEPNPPVPKKQAGLRHYVDASEFRDEIRISPANIDDAMMAQAGLTAQYGESHAQAEAQHSRLKLRAEIVEAALYEKHRKALIAAGEKPTEKMVESAMKRDPEWVAAKNRVIEAETIATINKSCTLALRDRKDMLVQIGADRRNEMSGTMRLMAEDERHRTNKQRALDAAGKH